MVQRFRASAGYPFAVAFGSLLLLSACGDGSAGPSADESMLTDTTGGGDEQPSFIADEAPGMSIEDMNRQLSDELYERAHGGGVMRIERRDGGWMLHAESDVSTASELAPLAATERTSFIPDERSGLAVEQTILQLAKELAWAPTLTRRILVIDRVDDDHGWMIRYRVAAM